ncbi:MAG TPA: phosphoadenylyl-sulfate reductase, partial [Pirellulales bacterium]
MSTLSMTESADSVPIAHAPNSARRPINSAQSFDDQPLQGTPELLAHLAAESEKLETARPWEIVQWAVDNYFPKLTMATAFGPEGCVIIHMLGQ